MTRQIRDYQKENVILIFGTNIRRSRQRLNISKAELSFKAKYDRICLSELEQGKQNIKLNTALKLARALNVSFPTLFSRNFMTESTKDNLNDTDTFSEDDYLLVFVENFKRRMRYLRRDQALVYIETGISESLVSRITQGKHANPTLQTLGALAYTANADPDDLFSRISSPKT